jgi:hypothetical protein
MTKNKLHTAIKYFIVFTIGTLIGLGLGLEASFNHLTPQSTVQSEEPIVYEISQKDVDLALEYGYVDSKRGFFYYYKEDNSWLKELIVYTYSSCDSVSVDVRNTQLEFFLDTGGTAYEKSYFTQTINVPADTTLYFYSETDISKYITCEYEEVRD